MKTLFDSFSRRPRVGRGFTLTELMVVLLIFVIVFTVGRGLLGGVLSSNHLTSEADRLVSALTEARQRSIARNIHVEVRFYRYLPQKRSSDAARFFSWEILEMLDDGTYLSIGERHDLPEPLVMSEDVRLSSLLMDQSRAAFDASRNEGFWNEAEAVYTSFRFEPDGSTDLPSWPLTNPEDQWFLTLVRDLDVPAPGENEEESAQNNSESDVVIPPDFVTIQVDPLTGQVKTYRPQ